MTGQVVIGALGYPGMRSVSDLGYWEDLGSRAELQAGCKALAEAVPRGNCQVGVGRRSSERD